MNQVFYTSKNQLTMPKAVIDILNKKYNLKLKAQNVKTDVKNTTKTTKVRATIDSYSCVFEITVFPEGTVMTSPEIYLTTAQNVVSLEKAGKTAKVNVSAVNLSASKYSQITWTISDSSIASVQDNGNNAVITALKEGEAIVTVSHPESQNSLKVYIRIGSEYIIQDSEPVVYISAPDVMTFLKDEQNKTLQAVLVNYSELNKAGILDKYNVKVIGVQVDAIERGEDRIEFKKTMDELGIGMARSDVSYSVDEALAIADELGYPVVLRPAYTMGGAGGGLVYNKEELK